MSGSDWNEEKAKLAKLSPEQIEERNAEKGAHSLKDVPPWTLYYKMRQKHLQERLSKAKSSKSVPCGSSSDPDVSCKVSLFPGDITRLGIDAIVNAANESLLGGGGVDGAIHRAAGRLLLQECRTLSGCPTGEAKITAGYNLPARFIIHTVGPIGENQEMLKDCYENSLALMAENELRTIAFPCISTGVYGYPSQKACPIALKAVKDFILKNPERLDRVIFCLFLEKDISLYETEMQRFFPVPAQK